MYLDSNKGSRAAARRWCTTTARRLTRHGHLCRGCWGGFVLKTSSAAARGQAHCNTSSLCLSNPLQAPHSCSFPSGVHSVFPAPELPTTKPRMCWGPTHASCSECRLTTVALQSDKEQVDQRVSRCLAKTVPVPEFSIGLPATSRKHVCTSCNAIPKTHLFSSIMQSFARCGCPAQIPRLPNMSERGEGRRPPHAGQHFLCFAFARPLWFICTLSFHPLQIPRPRDVPAQQLMCRFQSLPLAQMSFRDRCTTTHRVKPRSPTVAIVPNTLQSLQCSTRKQRSHLPTEAY